MRINLDALLSAETETEILEFKEAKSSFSKNKLGKYFSALGNEANLNGKEKAYLLFGVDDQRHIVGTSISDKTLNEYKKEIADHTSPSLSFLNIHRINTAEGDVIVFEIPPAPQGMPIMWKQHRYGRDGESLGGLNDHKLRQITSQNTDWSGQIIPDATIDDLDEEAIDFARKQYILKHPKLINEIQNWDNEKFLDKAKVTIKGKITHTSILLLGKPESEPYISPATARISWILKGKDNIEKEDRKSTRLNSSHVAISYAVFCLKTKNKT